MLVMDPMHRDPTCRSVLHGANPKQCQCVFEPLWSVHPSVGQQSVVPDIDPQGSKYIQTENTQRNSRPTKEPRDKSQACEQMNQRDRDRITPTDLNRFNGGRRSREDLGWIRRQNLRRLGLKTLGFCRLGIRKEVDRHGVCKLRCASFIQEGRYVTGRTGKVVSLKDDDEST